MLVGTEIFDKLRDLVVNADKYGENSVLDYKLIPHDPGHWCELYKDLLGLLNSYERPNEDRFLVYGVKDKTFEPIGYRFGETRGDADYQRLIDKIAPRPSIEFYEYRASAVIDGWEETKEGYRFGCFYIPGSNFGRVYEMSEQVIDKDPLPNGKCRMLIPGSSYFRKGSSTYPLMQEDREAIKSTINSTSLPVISSPWPPIGTGGVDAFALAAIFGGWDESNQKDIHAIERMTGMAYDVWVAPLKAELVLDGSAFAQHGTVCKVANREYVTSRFVGAYTETLLNHLKPIITEVLTTPDGRYELASDQRHLSQVLGKDKGFSDELRAGVSEFLAMVGTGLLDGSPIGARQKTGFLNGTLSDVLLSSDWRILATAAPCFPLLAEASPDAYLAFVERGAKGEGALLQYLQEGEKRLFDESYGQQLVAGIVYACRMRVTASRAVTLLMKLKPATKYAQEALIEILLPWCPLAALSVGARCALAERLIEEGCWDVLVKLLPGVTTSVTSLTDPKFLKVDTALPESINASEFETVGFAYADAAIEACSGDVEKSLDLVRHLYAINSIGKTSALMKALSAGCVTMGDEDAYRLWSALRLYVIKAEQYPTASWAPSEEALACIKRAENDMRPEDACWRTRFVFDHQEFELAVGDGLAERREAVAKERLALVESVYGEKGWEGIRDLGLSCKEKRALGETCAESSFADEMVDRMANALIDEGNGEELSDSKPLALVAQAFFRGYYQANGPALLAMLAEHRWPQAVIEAVYCSLPCVSKVWEKAEMDLPDGGSAYWSGVRPISMPKTNEDANHILEKLHEAQRDYDAIELAEIIISVGLQPDAELLLGCIESYVPGDTDRSPEFAITEVCGYIGRVSPSKRLAMVEYRLFPLLLRGEGKTPYLFTLMSRDPQVFVGVLKLSRMPCGDEGDEKDRKLRAYTILREWNVVPGTTSQGEFDAEAFDSWTAAALDIAERDGLADFALREIGKCLYHAPRRTDGLFLDEAVAKFLDEHEEARGGYDAESVNARGAYFVDPMGENEITIADGFDEQAAQMEEAGFFNFAATLRRMAQDHRLEAEVEREESE